MLKGVSDRIASANKRDAEAGLTPREKRQARLWPFLAAAALVAGVGSTVPYTQGETIVTVEQDDTATDIVRKGEQALIRDGLSLDPSNDSAELAADVLANRTGNGLPPNASVRVAAEGSLAGSLFGLSPSLDAQPIRK
jgi:hypothetical protein